MSKPKEKYRYIFPSKIAAKMKKIDMRTQLEASMLSLSLIMVGMVLMSLQIIIYGEQTWLFKGLLIFNLLCGFVLLSSNLVTSYQQYVFHLEQMGIDPDAEKAAIRAQGNLFKRIRKAIQLAKAHRALIKAETKRNTILAEIEAEKSPTIDSGEDKSPAATIIIPPKNELKEVKKIDKKEQIKEEDLNKIMEEERRFLEEN